VDQYAVPDEGLALNLDTLIRAGLILDQPLELRLYVNDLVPQRTTVLANYTEASFGGYSRRVIERADWSPAAVAADHVARIVRTAGAFTFTPTTDGQTVYGCYLVDVDAGKVRWQGRFATPKVLVIGTPFQVNPVITARAVVTAGG
jgi:hypothetical protein